MLDQCYEEAEKVESPECHTVECQSAECKWTQRFDPYEARHFSGMWSSHRTGRNPLEFKLKRQAQAPPRGNLLPCFDYMCRYYSSS
jgi:hypothetical protein